MSELATTALLLAVFAVVAAAGYGAVRVVWLACESLAGWWHDRRGRRDLRRRLRHLGGRCRGWPDCRCPKRTGATLMGRVRK